MRRFMLAALAAPFAACPALSAEVPVTAADAWCRAAPPGAPAGGCYLTLIAAAGDRLVAVETTASARAEIHTMSMDGGVMRMRRLMDGLPLPAGKAVALRPGGEHLMLIGPRQTLAAGGAVALTLRFAKAPPLKITAPIRAAAVPPAMGHGGHH